MAVEINFPAVTKLTGRQNVLGRLRGRQRAPKHFNFRLPFPIRVSWPPAHTHTVHNDGLKLTTAMKWLSALWRAWLRDLACSRGAQWGIEREPLATAGFSNLIE